MHGGIGVLTVLYLHDVTAVGAGPAALVLVAVQGASAAGRICLAAWSDCSGSGRYTSVLICLVAVTAGMLALITPSFTPVWALLSAMTLVALTITARGRKLR